MPSAVITGGSRGLGRALAMELGSLGWRVLVTGRDRDSLERALEEIPGSPIAIVGDVANPTHRARLVDAVGGELDLLVNNASLLGASPLRRFEDMPTPETRRVFDINVVAPLAITRRLLPALRRSGGIVVNMSSDAAVEAYPTWGPYGASKAALDHASAVLAAEESDVAVYAFDPGDMRTDMHQAAFPGEDISDRPAPESVAPILVGLIHERPPSGRYRKSDLLVETDG